MSLYATGVVRIISDLQMKTFDSGAMVCNFAAGIQEGKDKNGDYINNVIDVEVWNKAAEVIYGKLKKGDCLLLSGNIRRQDWIDKETGKKRSKHLLSASRFEFLPRASGETSSSMDDF